MAADIYARIRQVAFDLVGEGIWPTVVEVRSRLGTGSNTTINNTLKEWRQEFLSRMASSSRYPDWPTGLAEAFGMIWQKSCEAAEQQWEGMRKEAAAQVAAAEQEKTTLQAQLESVESALQSSLRELELRAARQQELEAKLQAAEQRHALLEANCLGLNEQLEQGRQSLLQLRQEAEERVAELESRHDQRLQEARQEAERRETLAYERLEGLRVRLYEQVEEERQSMKLATASLQDELQAARLQASRTEQQWRERLAERDREAGKQAARLEMLELRNAELQQACERQSVLSEQASARLLDMAGENARLASEMSAGLERQLARLASAMHDARQDLLVLDEAGMREWVSRQLQLPLG
ncbi:chromosome partition protein smc [Aquitalea magnusonii]|uniref:Chromosome partition protein smc n=1 Tax=Aquitalea magnusonii TaxID=332411 RepID=A0A3G9GJ97_9NEIS|nr:DNA-binding protein [Aquitalea magnusonii]BBF85607.1 chromosome partition protein smc [Aquitalea magnusonii]